MEEERVVIGGEDKGDVQHLRVVEGLLHAGAEGVIIVLGLNQGNGNVGLVVEDVVGAFRLAARDQLATNDDSPFREADFLTNLRVNVPSRRHDGRGDVLRADVALAQVLLVHAAISRGSSPGLPWKRVAAILLEQTALGMVSFFPCVQAV
jgi:hypothetical protein